MTRPNREAHRKDGDRKRTMGYIAGLTGGESEKVEAESPQLTGDRSKMRIANVTREVKLIFQGTSDEKFYKYKNTP